MSQHNHNEILEHRKRLDFISSRVSILLASVSVAGNIEYQNNTFSQFKKGLPEKGKDFIRRVVNLGLSGDTNDTLKVFNHPNGRYY